MTIEEAIETMKKEIEHNKNMLDREKDLLTGILKEMVEKTISAKKKAIEALEKQIPKKLKHGICPSCSTNNNRIIKHLGNPKAHKVVYCWNCGQAIDWSKE